MKSKECWLSLILLIIGWLFCDLSFEFLDDVKYQSIEFYVLGGFHFFGLTLALRALIEVYILAEKEVERRKKSFSTEV